MPYVHTKKKIPRALDRRVRFTEEDKQKVRDLYFDEGWAQRAIARETGMSRRMVSFVLFPEKDFICKSQYKERRKDGRYYDKDNHRIGMKKHRRYKESIKDKLVV